MILKCFFSTCLVFKSAISWPSSVDGVCQLSWRWFGYYSKRLKMLPEGQMWMAAVTFLQTSIDSLWPLPIQRCVWFLSGLCALGQNLDQLQIILNVIGLCRVLFYWHGCLWVWAYSAVITWEVVFEISHLCKRFVVLNNSYNYLLSIVQMVYWWKQSIISTLLW